MKRIQSSFTSKNKEKYAKLYVLISARVLYNTLVFLPESSIKVYSSKLTPKSDAFQKLRLVYKIGSPQGEEKVQSLREKLR